MRNVWIRTGTVARIEELKAGNFGVGSGATCQLVLESGWVVLSKTDANFVAQEAGSREWLHFEDGHLVGGVR